MKRTSLSYLLALGFISLCATEAFAADTVGPTTTVTAPANGNAYTSATVPTQFTGTVADAGGSPVAGLNANSTTFTLRRPGDNFYWTGSTWSSSSNALATTHAATSGTAQVNWTNSATLPTWSSETEGTYTVQTRGVDKSNNVALATAITFTLDNTSPTVSSIDRIGVNPTNGTSVRFRVTFSESVTGVDSSDFTLTTSGVSGASITSVTGSGTTYTNTVNTGTGDGTIRLDLNSSGTGIADTAGNAITTGLTSGQSYAIDKTAPTGLSIVRVGANPTNGTSVQFTVTFSENVTGVDATDFTNTVSRLSGTSVSSVSGSGDTYPVTVNTGTGSGTLRLDVRTAAVITDTAGNAVSGGFTGGETYTIDKTAPTVTINQASGQADPTNTSPINFTVVFSESVADFATGQ